MTFQSINNTFVGGEISPSVWGRTDLVAKWHTGASTMRNFYVGYRGGAYSRAGFAYVGMCKQPTTAAPPRDIPFQFNISQGYALEFGDQYMRVKSKGAYVTETAVNITGATNASTLVIHLPSHGYSVNDWVFIQNVGGMTALNGLVWIVSNATDPNYIQVTDVFGVSPNSTNWGTYTSGGTAARIYTLTTPYAAVDLPYLKYTQSADTMTLCCVNQATQTEYPPYQLKRLGAANWSLTAISFASSISAPSGISVVAQTSTTISTYYSYTVTAVDATTGDESIAGTPGQVENNDIAVYAGSNVVSYSSVTNSAYYNTYKATPAYSSTIPTGVAYGYAGQSTGTSFVDTNITADFTKTPPLHKNPFARGCVLSVVITAGGSGYVQSTVGYTITTSTGSGFSGVPIVTNGAITGFVINNGGSGYALTDTIAITGSGATYASGYYNFNNSNPTDSSNIVLNGITWTFKASGASGNQTNIQGTLAATLLQLATDLTNSANGSINVASYSVSGNYLNITYKTTGTGGNSYSLAVGTYAGAVSGATLTGGVAAGGSSATATLSVGAESGTYPSVPAYFQQRSVFANTLNNPDTYWMSQTASYKNFDESIPTIDSDSVVGTPWALQVNGIQFMKPMPNGLVILTGGGAWLLTGNGSSGSAVTPAQQTATAQAYNGCSPTVQPIVISYDVLYVQSKGSVVRDLSYNFFTNVYAGQDITQFSAHLFQNHTITQWAYAEEPYKYVWAIRDDGILLSLTYIKDQEVCGWARHDTKGLFVSICSVVEPPVDAIYVITKRYINGGWYYYSERMDNRLWQNVEDSFCVDAGLKYTQSFPNATLTPSGTSGQVTLTASSAVFSAGDVGSVVRVGGGICTIALYISSTQVTATVKQPITFTTPDDPNNTPLPVLSGNWSVSVATTTVTGLNHLVGQTVSILADGSVSPNQTVVPFSDGTVGITLPYDASAIAVGLGYTCQLQTLYLDPTGQPMTVQSKRKTIPSVSVRLENTRGISVGTNQPDQSTQANGATPAWGSTTPMVEIKQWNIGVGAGNPIPLFTGDYFVNLPSNWDTKGQVAFSTSYPLPANILACVSYFSLGDTPG